jgi:hypothetical protein
MILAIWEGTSHRQILDGMEVMERKGAHKMLFQHLRDKACGDELEAMESEIERHLKLPTNEKEGLSEALFRRLAIFVQDKLSSRQQG